MPIKALVLGEEKLANPRPRRHNPIMMIIKLVSSTKKVNNIHPMVLRIIPNAATLRGSAKSDNFPASGENMVIITGCTAIIIPAHWGSNPLTYCKYKLSKNTMGAAEQKLIKAARLYKVNSTMKNLHIQYWTFDSTFNEVEHNQTDTSTEN